MGPRMNKKVLRCLHRGMVGERHSKIPKPRMPHHFGGEHRRSCPLVISAPGEGAHLILTKGSAVCRSCNIAKHFYVCLSSRMLDEVANKQIFPKISVPVSTGCDHLQKKPSSSFSKPHPSKKPPFAAPVLGKPSLPAPTSALSIALARALVPRAGCASAHRGMAPACTAADGT